MAGILKIRKGFSLVEVIVALGILGTVLLPFLGYVAYRLAQERRSDELLRAIEIAQASLEEVLTLDQIRDSVAVIEDRFVLELKVYDGDNADEPPNLEPLQVDLRVSSLTSRTRLVELTALK